MGKDAIEKIGDDIYNSLVEIQTEAGIRLDNKGFIADYLSQKLHNLGYLKPDPKHRHYFKTIIISGNGIRHQLCRCGKKRIIDIKGVVKYDQ